MNNSEVLDYLADVAKSKTLIRHSKHAAAITYKQKVLAVGEAKYKTHPMQQKYSSHPERIYLHAEIDAIIKVINKHGTEILEESVLHVVRLTKAGKLSNSKPCEGCMRAINAFKIKGIQHS